MATVKIKTNFRKTTVNLKKFEKKFPVEMDQAFRNGGNAIVKSLKTLTPKQTTKASNSYFVKKVRRLVYFVSNSVSYIDDLEFGTGLFGPKKALIKPKKGKALAFVDKGRRGNRKLGITRRKPMRGDPKRGGKVFFTSVKGFKPHNMFKITERKADKIVNIFVKARIRAILRVFNVA